MAAILVCCCLLPASGDLDITMNCNELVPKVIDYVGVATMTSSKNSHLYNEEIDHWLRNNFSKLSPLSTL